jgi:phosphoribosyl 1,2-cyclic phosphodiesterase
MKAVIWGSCGSLPYPASSAVIRQKVKDALWSARNEGFSTPAEVDKYIDAQPHSSRGTYKANTSCVQIEAGTDDIILCDAGTGIRDFAFSVAADSPARTYHIFVSHLHWDHIQGFPFFTPAYIPGNRIIFHGFHKTIESAIREQMRAPCFPVPIEAMQATIEFDIREDGDTFDVGEVHIRTFKQQHPGDSWGYRFEHDDKSIIYSSDSEHGPEAAEADYPFVDFIEGADILIFDGQYSFEEARNIRRHWGHSDPRTAVELAARAQVKELVVSHHEPTHSDRKIEELHIDAIKHLTYFHKQHMPNAAEIYPKLITLAYDGLTVEA